MAALGKIGPLAVQNMCKSSFAVCPAPSANMLNAVRCMATKLFIGGLSYGTDDQSLREAFTSFGEVTEARVITDRMTGRSRGFGFVGFTTDESASQAMSSMDGQELQDRNIRVSFANERPSYGGGGAYGGCSTGQDGF